MESPTEYPNYYIQNINNKKAPNVMATYPKDSNNIYAIMIGVIALVAYFVIKKAIKDALRERDEEKKS